MLQIGVALFYYKLGQTLLQIGAASLLQIRASVVTNWGSYYKLGQPLLQNRAAITNWGKMYHKLGQVLQIKAIITNWGIANIYNEIIVEKCFSKFNCLSISTPNRYFIELFILKSYLFLFFITAYNHCL